MSSGWRIAIAGILAFLLVVALVPLCRRFALARGICDTPEPGKVHRNPTPYLGGVCIAVSAVLCSLVLPGWQSEARDAALILVAAGIVSVTGLFDDVRGLGPMPRLVAEIGAALLAVSAGARIQVFGDPVDVLVSVVALVVLTNSFNLLDNMDSAAGAIAATIATALAVTALLQGQLLVGGLAVVVASACLGFLVYNWHPASIFMGDAGSLFLGFLLAVIALKLRTGVGHFPSAVAAALLVAPAVLDTALVVVSRLRSGRPVYVGGTDHSSHRLMLLGVGRRGARRPRSRDGVLRVDRCARVTGSAPPDLGSRGRLRAGRHRSHGAPTRGGLRAGEWTSAARDDPRGAARRVGADRQLRNSSTALVLALLTCPWMVAVSVGCSSSGKTAR